MMTATALCASLLCIGICAGAQKEPTAVFACNLKAITAAYRPRYHELMKRLRLAVRNRSEIANGYTFKLDSKAVTLPEAAEWISMERLCCPFLTLQLSVSANQPHWILTLTGPEGIFVGRADAWPSSTEKSALVKVAKPAAMHWRERPDCHQSRSVGKGRVSSR